MNSVTSSIALLGSLLFAYNPSPHKAGDVTFEVYKSNDFSLCLKENPSPYQGLETRRVMKILPASQIPSLSCILQDPHMPPPTKPTMFQPHWLSACSCQASFQSLHLSFCCHGFLRSFSPPWCSISYFLYMTFCFCLYQLSLTRITFFAICLRVFCLTIILRFGMNIDKRKKRKE